MSQMNIEKLDENVVNKMILNNIANRSEYIGVLYMLQVTNLKNISHIINIDRAIVVANDNPIISFFSCFASILFFLNL